MTDEIANLVFKHDKAEKDYAEALVNLSAAKRAVDATLRAKNVAFREYINAIQPKVQTK